MKSGRIEKILIIDDSAEDQTLYERYLMRTFPSKVILIKKEKGADALKFLEENTVNCILLDYHLPDMTGLTFLEKGFSRKVLKAPVIMLTGQGNEKVAVSSLKLGAYDYLMKNELSPGQLCKAIANAIEKSFLIEKIRAQESEMRFLAYHDYLTDIPNRRQLEETAAKSLSRAERFKKTFAILMIDLDHFKNINDSLGHEAGDLLLRQVSQRLLSVLRKNDTIARLGGDEFAIILDFMEETDNTTLVVKRVLKAMEDPFILNDQEATISLSIGIAVYPESGDTISVLMRNADAALYQAKDAGRNTYRYFTQELNTKALDHLAIENAAREALKKQEFYLCYQPIFNVSDDTLYGFEALLRWHSKKLEKFSPTQLIPIVEDCGLIVPLGIWILETAIMQFSSLKDHKKMNISINLSPKQLAEPGFIDHVKSLVSEFQVRPENIIFELTETAIIIDIKNTIHVLTELRDLGCRIFIDDFGTGYSSLSFIRKLPIAGLKIDQVFVQGAEKNSEDTNMVKSLFALAENMHLSLIAEGIENQEQLTLVRAYHDAKGQGYFLGRPIPIEDVLKTTYKMR